MSELLTPDLTLKTGEELRLRRLTESDASDLVRIRANDEFIRWADPVAITYEKAVEVIERANAPWETTLALLLAMTARDDDTPLGTIGLAFDARTRARVGYDVAPDCRGQGFATASLRLVSRWAFNSWPGLDRLEALIVPGNDASVLVAERAGFQREDIARSRLPFGDEFRDVIVYSLIRGDL